MKTIMQAQIVLPAVLRLEEMHFTPERRAIINTNESTHSTITRTKNKFSSRNKKTEGTQLRVTKIDLLQRLNGHERDIANNRRDNVYPTTVRSTRLRNELNVPIWVKWRDGTVQHIPFFRNGDNRGVIEVTTDLTINSKIGKNYNFGDGLFDINNNEMPYVYNTFNTRIENDEPGIPIFIKNFSASLKLNRQYDVAGVKEQNTPDVSSVSVYLTYDDLVGKDTGVYISELDIIIALNPILGEVTHPALFNQMLDVPIVPPIVYGDTEHNLGCTYASIMIVDHHNLISNKKFMRFGVDIIPIVVNRDVRLEEGIYLHDFDFKWFGGYDNIHKHNDKTILPLACMEELGIFSSVEEVLHFEEGTVAHKHNERLQRENEAMSIRLKFLENEAKERKFMIDSSMDANKANNEFIVYQDNQKRNLELAERSAAREELKHKREMFTEITKVVSACLTTITAVLIFVNRKK